jgi:hypothetical protein
MNIITAADRAEAVQVAEELYDLECDLLKCPTSKEKRVTKVHSEPFQHVDSKEFAVLVPDRALGVVSMLSAGAAAKLVLVAARDVEKWSPESMVNRKEDEP